MIHNDTEIETEGEREMHRETEMVSDQDKDGETPTDRETHTGTDRGTQRQLQRQSEKRKWSLRASTPPLCLPLFQTLPWTPRLFGCYCQPLTPKRQKGPRGRRHVGALHPYQVAPSQPVRWCFLPGVRPRGPQDPHTCLPRGSCHLRYVLNQTPYRLHPSR